MDQLITCTKCHSVPYDVLMLNCNHNLCVKCANLRLESQHTGKSLTGRHFLQCEKCKTRTNLDEESSAELEKARKGKMNDSRLYQDGKEKRVQTPIGTGRMPSSNNNKSKQTLQLADKKEAKSNTSVAKNKQQPKRKLQKSPTKQKQASDIIVDSRYGCCQVHHEQPVMYYCFNCKIHCFCAECVLVGRHNQHDVKVIKKAYTKIEKQFEDMIAGTRKFIGELHEKNRQVMSDINASKNKADSIKRSIEQGFDEIRLLIKQKEDQFMKTVDKHFMKMMETNNGLIKKSIEAKLKEQQELLESLNSTVKQGEGAALNFYSDAWASIVAKKKMQEIKLPSAQSLLDQALAQYVKALKNQIQKVQVRKIE